MSRFFIGAVLRSDTVLSAIRRELRRISPDVRIDYDQISEVLTAEVIKREVLEGAKAAEARKNIARGILERSRPEKGDGG